MLKTPNSFPSDEKLSQCACFFWHSRSPMVYCQFHSTSLHVTPTPISHHPRFLDKTVSDIYQPLDSLFDSGIFYCGNATSKDLFGRASLLDGDDLLIFHAHVRVIVLTILTTLLGLLPALIGVVWKFNTMVSN
jgi:hypothetical protein